MSSASIKHRAAFDFIRYASVWEDADILCEALAPAADGGRLLSIASSGDNALALLTLNPAEVHAVDLSAAQMACVELRVAAFRELEHLQLLAFLGVLPCGERAEIYARLRSALSAEAAAFWDSLPAAVEQGIIHCGKFERYLRAFGQYMLPLVHSKRKRHRLLERKTVSDQQQYYAEHWDSWLWRALFRVFFSKKLMGLMGRDPAFFDHVEGSVASRILKRTRHALTEIPTYSNPYLTYIITGNYAPEALPRYLRPEFTPLVRSRLERLVLHHGTIQEACEGHFDGFNLSDIFEYMSEDEYTGCYEKLVQHANKGARIAYWNMLVPRSCPDALSERVRPMAELAADLHCRDKAWFYQGFHVDEVQ